MRNLNPVKPTPIGQSESDLIKLARVFCIIFMMTTHSWPGLERTLIAQIHPVSHSFFLVMDVMGRASVPLLSLFSGVLFFNSFTRYSRKDILQSKFLTLIVPMIVWSIPMIVLFYAQKIMTGQADNVPVTTMDWINSLFAITSAPANGALHFLRDIFLMAIYGCILLTLYRYNRFAALVLGLAILIFEQIPSGGLLFRNTIATFYLIGMLVAERRWLSWKPGWLIVLCAMAILIIARQYDLLYMHDDIWTRRISDHIPRIAAVLLTWRLCSEIATHAGRLKTGLLALEPHIFTIFCSHQITLKFVAAAALFLHADEHNALYPLFFVGQIILCVVVGFALSLLLKPFPWLRGKKSSKRKTTPSYQATTQAAA